MDFFCEKKNIYIYTFVRYGRPWGGIGCVFTYTFQNTIMGVSRMPDKYIFYKLNSEINYNFRIENEKEIQRFIDFKKSIQFSQIRNASMKLIFISFPNQN